MWTPALQPESLLASSSSNGSTYEYTALSWCTHSLSGRKLHDTHSNPKASSSPLVTLYVVSPGIYLYANSQRSSGKRSGSGIRQKPVGVPSKTAASSSRLPWEAWVCSRLTDRKSSKNAKPNSCDKSSNRNLSKNGLKNWGSCNWSQHKTTTGCPNILAHSFCVEAHLPSGQLTLAMENHLVSIGNTSTKGGFSSPRV